VGGVELDGPDVVVVGVVLELEVDELVGVVAAEPVEFVEPDAAAVADELDAVDVDGVVAGVVDEDELDVALGAADAVAPWPVEAVDDPAVAPAGIVPVVAADPPALAPVGAGAATAFTVGVYVLPVMLV
jgi:hypothetical protein